MTADNDNDQQKFWLSPVPDLDDLGNVIHDEFYDGRLRGSTAWGLMTPDAWSAAGCGKTGLGNGQRYKKQPDGRWLCVEG